MRNVVSRTNVDHAWARARLRQVAAPGTTLRPSAPAWIFQLVQPLAAPRVARRAKRGGACRDRTDDLKLAKLALSQLSYGPNSVTNQTPKDWLA